MCGIAGVASINKMPIDPQNLKRMCETLRHRGPDDAGYVFFRPDLGKIYDGGYWSNFTDDNFKHVNENLPSFDGEYFKEEFSKNNFGIALGHRRLSIIDLSPSGHQPMPSSDRRYWVVFNGEIYNYREIKKELIQKNHIFQTKSDTEVLLHLWEEYGTSGIEFLNGMFAFAIYDRLNNKLTLARDRFGVKPLYYCFAKDFFVFSSEIKGILASGLIIPEIDAETMVEYFTFQNVYGKQTIFKNIKIVQPGELIILSPMCGESAKYERFHRNFPAADKSLLKDKSIVEKVSETFQIAVTRQLISDVEVGSYLSGGMDSGSIVSVAGRTIPRLMTFTGGFDLTNVDGIEQGFDERKIAEKLSYLLQTEHYSVVLHAGDMPAAMEKITWHVDDPRVGMCHQNWYVAKLASRFVKVCLAGAGGDELFAGYPWRYKNGYGAKNFADFDNNYYNYWHRLLPPKEISNLFQPDLKKYYKTTRNKFNQVMKDAPQWQEDLDQNENILIRALYFEFKTFLQGFLVIEDRISMAHSLESRVPFLDNDLVDLSWRIPPSMKLKICEIKNDKKYLKSSEGKTILRTAMRSFLPIEFLHQQKQGFSPPDENWYRGPSMDYIKEILKDSRTLQRPFFDNNFVNQKLEEHFEGKRNHRLLIWSLLSIEWLQRHYIDG
jgi:asparagine synthase (glutamine-hydrolysing)